MTVTNHRDKPIVGPTASERELEMGDDLRVGISDDGLIMLDVWSGGRLKAAMDFELETADQVARHILDMVARKRADAAGSA